MINTRIISAANTRDLRSRILRPGQPPEATVYPGDDAESTLHLGAFRDDASKDLLVGIASIYCEALPRDAHTPNHAIANGSDWRLRGMAVIPEARRTGAGRALYTACLEHLRAAGGRRLWFNARTSAFTFYRALGADLMCEEFDIPGIGPHVRMASLL